MAKKSHLGEKGNQNVDIHNTDEVGNLWLHHEDEELPSADDLRRGEATALGRQRKDRHPGIPLFARLSTADVKRLRRLQRRGQMSFVDWVRHAIALDEQERPSEAQHYPRRIVPEQVAVIAERELIIAANNLMAVAERQTDWEARKNLRADAGVIMEVAAWHSESCRQWEDIRRREKSESPTATTRGNADHTPALSTTARRRPPSPDV